MATIVTQIPATTDYVISDEILLNPSITQSSFDPSQNYIEYTIETPDKSFVATDYNYNNYSFPNDGVTSDYISNIIINPNNDIISLGYNSGEFNTYYNFLKNELDSSPFNQIFFIKEISYDRTEVTLGYTVDSSIVVFNVNNFKTQLNSNPNYFQDFFLNLGGNNLYTANNIAVNNTTLDVIVNLYEPLSSNVQIKDIDFVVFKINKTFL